MYARRLLTVMTLNDEVIPSSARKRFRKRCVFNEHTASFFNLKVSIVRQLCKSFTLVQRCFRVYARRLQTVMTFNDEVIPNSARKRLS